MAKITEPVGKITRVNLNYVDSKRLDTLLGQNLRTIEADLCEYLDPKMDDAAMAIKAAESMGTPITVFNVRHIRRQVYGELRAPTEDMAPRDVSAALSEIRGQLAVQASQLSEQSRIFAETVARVNHMESNFQDLVSILTKGEVPPVDYRERLANKYKVSRKEEK